MTKVRYEDANFEVLRLFGKDCLFTEDRLDRDTIPEGLYVYDIRHSDDEDATPCTLEIGPITVNRYGTIITDLEIGYLYAGNDYLIITNNDYEYSDRDVENLMHVFDIAADPYQYNAPAEWHIPITALPKPQMNIFVSQPMNGINPAEVMNNMDTVYHACEALFPSREIVLIDQYDIEDEKVDNPDDTSHRVYCLGRSIQMLADADLVVFAGDVLSTKGCIVELSVCQTYDIPYMTMKQLMTDLRNRDICAYAEICKKNAFPAYNVQTDDTSEDGDKICQDLDQC